MTRRTTIFEIKTQQIREKLSRQLRVKVVPGMARLTYQIRVAMMELTEVKMLVILHGTRVCVWVMKIGMKFSRILATAPLEER